MAGLLFCAQAEGIAVEANHYEVAKGNSQ